MYASAELNTAIYNSAAQRCQGIDFHREASPLARICCSAAGKIIIAPAKWLNAAIVSASYFPATLLPNTAYVANPSEPVMVIASPKSEGDRGDIPFSDASAATPANAMAMPITLCPVAFSNRNSTASTSVYIGPIPTITAAWPTDV